MNHVGADKQGYSHPTTVTQRPLQILPLSCGAAVESDTTEGSARGEERQMNPSPIHNHYHHPHSHPSCHQSPIPSNANLNNANVPSLLAMNAGRQQRCLLRRDRPSSTKSGSSACTYTKGAHDKSWKSHPTRWSENKPSYKRGFVLNALLFAWPFPCHGGHQELILNIIYEFIKDVSILAMLGKDHNQNI